MSSYWKGIMNWPIDSGWRCETCGGTAYLLEWGLINGECRCMNCHTRYKMKDEQGNIVTTPQSQMLPFYKEAAIAGWRKWKLELDKWNDNRWDEALELARKAS